VHHPLRAGTSRMYIPASLAMLEEIQRTGDIFFRKRWMDATLSGHSSASAALMVKTFIAELPTLSRQASTDHPVFDRRTNPRRALDGLLLFARAAATDEEHADDADQNC
jgi:hypothetical protein